MPHFFFSRSALPHTIERSHRIGRTKAPYLSPFLTLTTESPDSEVLANILATHESIDDSTPYFFLFLFVLSHSIERIKQTVAENLTSLFLHTQHGLSSALTLITNEPQ